MHFAIRPVTFTATKIKPLGVERWLSPFWKGETCSNETNIKFSFLTSSKLNLVQFSYFGTVMPKYGNPAPDPRFLNFFENFDFIEFYLPICFQRALNHFPNVIFGQFLNFFHMLQITSTIIYHFLTLFFALLKVF